MEEKALSDYGFSGGNKTKKQKLAETVENSVTVATPYLSAPLSDHENSFYQVSMYAGRAAAVAYFVAADAYNTRALQAYRNMDFTGDSVSAQYLKSIGCHRENASVSVVGASSQKDQLHAMRDIYQAGLNSMQKSSNLVDIYNVRNKGTDTVKKEIAKAQNAIDKQIREISRHFHNPKLEACIKKDMLSREELSDVNKLINGSSLSTKEKVDLKQLLADKNELAGFQGVGAISGGDIDRLKGQKMRGARIISSKLLGESQQGFDMYRAAYKITKTSAKIAYSTVRKTTYHAASAAITVARVPAFAVDKIVSKSLHTNSQAMTNYTKRMNERRISSMQKYEARAEARKNGTYKRYKEKEKQDKYTKKGHDIADEITRNQTRLTGARNKKNQRLVEKYEKRDGKLKRRKTCHENQLQFLDKWAKKKIGRQTRLNHMVNKLSKPFRLFTKPIDDFHILTQRIRKFFIKVGLCVAGAVCVLPVAAVLLGILIGAPLTLLFQGNPAKLSDDGQYNKEVSYGIMKELGVSDEYAAAYLGMWAGESGCESGCVECDYILKPNIKAMDLSAFDDYADRCIAVYENAGISINKSMYHQAFLGKRYGTCGVGFAQWTGMRTLALLFMAEEKGLNWYDLDAQWCLLLHDDPETREIGDVYKKNGKAVGINEYQNFMQYTKKGAATVEQALKDVVPFEYGSYNEGYYSARLFHAWSIYNEIKEGINYDEAEVQRILALAGIGINAPAAEYGQRTVVVNGKRILLNFCYPIGKNSLATSEFGPRNTGIAGASTNHKGIDLAVAEGTGIRAYLDGTVIAAGYNQFMGNYITIRHTDGICTRYEHFSGLLVSAGDRVVKGQVIGASGNTGASSGPHLHFTVLVNNVPVNPRNFIETGSWQHR